MSATPKKAMNVTPKKAANATPKKAASAPKKTTVKAPAKTAASEFHEVVIVGAGFSGIGTAISLKKAGFTDILLVDDASGVGGVWHWNNYPGVAVDIPSFSYQFSFEQASSWSRTYAPGRELKGYAEKCVKKYGLAKYMRFNTRVEEARFDDAANLWQIKTSSGNLQARWMIHAGGPLSQPSLPNIKGIDGFKGQIMHTSRWDHSIDLAGKQVGIIGTGATAVQVIPEIAPQVEQLTVFQRTPIWCLPKPDLPLPSALRLGLKAIPGVKAVSRLASQAFVEFTFPGIAHFYSLIPGAGSLEKFAKGWIDSQVKDPVTRAKLTPHYALGCKRPSFHNGFLKTFNRANVTLETTSIAEVTAHGIRHVDGSEHQLDVLILATGFKVTDKDAMPSYPVFGAGSEHLGEHWDEGHHRSYQGIATTGFPNYFTIFGPYGYNGASFFTLIEASAAHITRLLTAAKQRDAKRVEVKQASQDAFMEDMLSRGHRQVFRKDSCQYANSYYFTRHGDVPFRAATTLEVLWKSKRFPLTDYQFQSAK